MSENPDHVYPNQPRVWAVLCGRPFCFLSIAGFGSSVFAQAKRGRVILQCDMNIWVNALGNQLRSSFTASLSGAYHERVIFRDGHGAREGSGVYRRWADHALSA